MRARAIGLTLCTVATLGLAACTKPTPEVTVWTGTASVQQSAACWAPDSTQLGAVAQCIQQAANTPNQSIPQIAVTPGEVIGINVDEEIAHAGWVPQVGQQALSAGTLTQTYYRFEYPSIETPPEGFLLMITAKGENQGSDRGLWLVRLMPSGTL